MPATKNAFRGLTRKLKRAVKEGNSQLVDQLLDHWVDIRDRATEYDAAKWGFDPEHWMAPERMTMERLARGESAGYRQRPIQHADYPDAPLA